MGEDRLSSVLGAFSVLRKYQPFLLLDMVSLRGDPAVEAQALPVRRAGTGGQGSLAPAGKVRTGP